MSIVNRDESFSTRTNIRAESVSTNLRARLLFGAFVHVRTQVGIVRIGLETGMTLALVSDCFVDAHVSTRFGQAFVDVCNKRNEKNGTRSEED